MALLRIDIVKWIGIGLTIIGVVISAVVWASNEHSDLKDTARIEIRESQKESREITKEQYTPLHKFTKIEQQIDNNSNTIDKIDKDIGKLDVKLDTLLENMIRRRVHNNNRNE